MKTLLVLVTLLSTQAFAKWAAECTGTMTSGEESTVTLELTNKMVKMSDGRHSIPYVKTAEVVDDMNVYTAYTLGKMLVPKFDFETGRNPLWLKFEVVLLLGPNELKKTLDCETVPVL